MHFTRPPVSQLRLQRLARWAQLWLRWFAGFVEVLVDAGFLSKQAEAVGHRWLDRVERLVLMFGVIEAGRRVRHVPAKRFTHGPRLRRGGFIRAVFGSALLRALRPRGLVARIHALRIDIADLAARIAKRIPRGLTRRRPIRAAAGDTPLICAPGPVAALCQLAVDTS